MVECSECGHKHYDSSERAYVLCPLASEGCECMVGQDDGSTHGTLGEPSERNGGPA